MAIGEAKATATVVVGGGDISPVESAGFVDENAVIYRVGVLVENDPGLPWFEHGGCLEVLKVLRKKPVQALGSGIRRRTEASEKGIHGDAPKPALPPCSYLAWTEKRIRRTLINPDRIREVFPKDPIYDPGHIGITLVLNGKGGAPRHDVVRPVIERAGLDVLFSLRYAVTVYDAVTIIRRVHGPCSHELPKIVEATRSFAVGLGFGQGGQEQKAEGRNESHDDKQFDQSKTC